jgi:hypothetical protein
MKTISQNNKMKKRLSKLSNKKMFKKTNFKLFIKKVTILHSIIY